ncbi:MAG TPA: hypothetical protein VFC62_05835 [Atopostipes sp.]|nr:hypothetical protein [Atopostipes sp.]
MRLKFRLLYLPVLAAFALAGCDSETMKEASIEETVIQEEIQNVETETTEVLALEESTESSERSVEETDEAEEITQESAEVSEVEELNDTAVEEKVVEELAALDPKSQQAINQLLAETGINLEDYIFLFSETDDYIEIDIRESIDSDTTVAVGLYRYNLETNELLVNDYLTGEFIPVEIEQ